MQARYFRRRSVRTLWALLAVFALLYAQGLRVCIHGTGGADSPPSDAQASGIYLEGALTPSDESRCSTDQDISLAGIVADAPATVSLFLLFLPAPLVLLPPRRLLGTVPLSQPLFATGRGHSLRPPLRAPPR